MRSLYLLLTVLLVSEISGETLDFLILHNNDMHGRFEETSRNSGTCQDKTPRTGRVINKKGCVGGFARTAYEIRKHRKLADEGGRPVLYLNAGDTYVGTAWFAVHKWKICAEFLNLLKPDAASLGNHEFDFGIPALAPFVDAVQFPIVAANLNLEKEPTIAKVKKSAIVEVAGRKVGIIGHITPDTRLMSSPGAVEFLDVVESVKKEAESLDQQGVKIIIALGHSGYDMDRRIAAEIPLIDVVIGGHTNTFLWNGAAPDTENPEDLYPKVITQRSGKKVPVVQAYAYTKYLGRLNVTFDGEGNLINFEGQPIFLDTTVPQDSQVVDLLETYRPQILAINEEVVGRSSVLLDATANKCRVRECNLANLVADAFVYYMAAQYAGPGWTSTPIGIVNGGSIRTTIDPSGSGGNITRGELMGTLPFENQVVSMTLNGSAIRQSLEVGVRSNGETSKGEFLQFSGLRAVYDLNQPAYSRVVSVKVRCGNCSVPAYEPLDDNKLYNLVTLSFLSNGGDDHRFLADGSNKQVQDLADVDTVVWYLDKHKLVYPEEQGKIEFTKSSAGRVLFGPVTLFLVVTNNLVSNFLIG